MLGGDGFDDIDDILNAFEDIQQELLREEERLLKQYQVSGCGYLVLLLFGLRSKKLVILRNANIIMLI